jgi:hypothetical protein
MPATGTAPRSTGRRLKKSLALLLLVVVAAIGLYTWLALTWKYSEGERAGLLQKFSRKGWICKTYEGELALYVVAGVAPEIWRFSVRDSALAQQLASDVGQRVQLHYAEHRGVPTECFGETGYFVDRINSIGEAPPATAPAR